MTTNPLVHIAAAAVGGAGLAFAICKLSCSSPSSKKSSSGCCSSKRSACTCEDCKCASKAGAPANSKTDKIVVGYWAIRGLAAPLRMLCTYVGANAEFRNYELKGQAPDYDYSSWFADAKPAILSKNEMANLPYVEHQGRVVTQSSACFTYLGRVFGLNGNTFEELWKNDQCLAETLDLRNDLVRVVYGDAGRFDEDIKKHFSGSLAKTLAKFEKWLEQQGTRFIVSDEVATADFHFWEMLDQHETIAKRLHIASPLAAHPRLQVYFNDFAALPAIRKYLDSDAHKLPMNMVYANV